MDGDGLVPSAVLEDLATRVYHNADGSLHVKELKHLLTFGAAPQFDPLSGEEADELLRDLGVIRDARVDSASFGNLLSRMAPSSEASPARAGPCIFIYFFAPPRPAPAAPNLRTALFSLYCPGRWLASYPAFQASGPPPVIM